jgi:hypothetical protein
MDELVFDRICKIDRIGWCERSGSVQSNPAKAQLRRPVRLGFEPARRVNLSESVSLMERRPNRVIVGVFIVRGPYAEAGSVRDSRNG